MIYTLFFKKDKGEKFLGKLNDEFLDSIEEDAFFDFEKEKQIENTPSEK